MLQISQESGIIDMPLGIEVPIAYSDGVEEAESGHENIIHDREM
jgi:hypothetical protein